MTSTLDPGTTDDGAPPAMVPAGASGLRAALSTASALDVWGRRALALLLAAAVVIAGVLLVVTGGVELDAELGGGDTYTVPAALSRDAVFDALDAAGVGSGAEVALGRSIPGEQESLTVRLGREHRAATADVRAALAAAAGVDSEQVGLDLAGRGWSEDAARRAVLVGSIAAAVAAFLAMFVLGWRAALAGLLAAVTAVTFIGGVLALTGTTVGENHLLLAAAVAVLAFFVSTLVTGQARANRARFREAGLGSADLHNVSANQALPATIAAIGVPLVVAVAVTVAALVGGYGVVVGLGLVAIIGLVVAWFAGVYVTVALVAALGDRHPALDGVDHDFHGETLRSVVAGGAATLTSVTGRKRAVERAASGAERTVARTVSPTATTEQILTHPARPRKKKRH